MIKPEYIGVDASELLGDLIDITGSYTEAETCLDEVVDAYQIEYLEELRVKKGEITREQVEKEREYRRLSRTHSDRLRRNMEAKGRFGPDNTSAHHIVAWCDEDALRSRRILEQVGIKIDDEVNGVYLPTYKKHVPHPAMPNAYAHSEVHTETYYLNIADLLAQNENDKTGAETTLRTIGESLSKGTFPIKERIVRK